MNAGFGDRDCLLFHGFMDSDLVTDIHFIKFVDSTDAATILTSIVQISEPGNDRKPYWTAVDIPQA
jgi:hypothetical protein